MVSVLGIVIMVWVMYFIVGYLDPWGWGCINGFWAMQGPFRGIGEIHTAYKRTVNGFYEVVG